MHNLQIIILLLAAIIVIACYIKVSFAILKKNPPITGFGFTVIWLLTSLLIITFNFMSLNKIKELENKVKGKCPEYQKIENVYQLKP